MEAAESVDSYARSYGKIYPRSGSKIYTGSGSKIYTGDSGKIYPGSESESYNGIYTDCAGTLGNSLAIFAVQFFTVDNGGDIYGERCEKDGCLHCSQELEDCLGL